MPGRVAIIGGGPAGALAAERLARAGRAVTIFEERPGWEKPCGGGVTDKALQAYPFLREGAGERQWVRECEIIGRDGRRARLRLTCALAVFSRQTLNSLVLDRARRAGAEIAAERVTGLERVNAPGRRWRLRLRGGAEAAADFVLLAAGARNSFRMPFGLDNGAGDSMTALGYYVPGGGERIQIQFLPGLAGYLWAFPRPGHYAAGICGQIQGQPAAALRPALEAFLDREGYGWAGSQFYAHVLPAPRAETLRKRRFSGADWAVVGDAAGLVDPITGEGLYYALRSAELFAAAYLRGQPEALGPALRADFLPDLELAAEIAGRFYEGRFLGRGVIERMIQFTARSPRFQVLMGDLFAGSQGYIGLRRRLYRQLGATLWEAAWARN
ncbi:MAG: NAD(P)-binding protein [Terriglobales bacterium]